MALSNNKTDIDNLTEILLTVALSNNKIDIDNLTEILLTVALSNNKIDIDNLTEIMLKMALDNNEFEHNDLTKISLKVALNNNKTDRPTERGVSRGGASGPTSQTRVYLEQSKQTTNVRFREYVNDNFVNM